MLNVSDAGECDSFCFCLSEFMFLDYCSFSQATSVVGERSIYESCLRTMLFQFLENSVNKTHIDLALQALHTR